MDASGKWSTTRAGGVQETVPPGPGKPGTPRRGRPTPTADEAPAPHDLPAASPADLAESLQVRPGSRPNHLVEPPAEPVGLFDQDRPLIAAVDLARVRDDEPRAVVPGGQPIDVLHEEPGALRGWPRVKYSRLLRQRPGRVRDRALQNRAHPAAGSWRGLEDVELATLEWVWWFNYYRLLEPIGYVPPAEYEEAFYGRETGQPERVRLNSGALR